MVGIPILEEKFEGAEEFLEFENVLVVGITEGAIFIETEGLNSV